MLSEPTGSEQRQLSDKVI